ncbi:penicillin acylase family protein [Burkholderia sp. BDU5]|uniref:penicillin acylase family protein n=1 Tax=Burkholderia sp. BDU5 TaxID=1385590 RepID=UPI000751EDEF|nr:penicillin acylase family protein [Burkholderia sp. BDU5]KVE34327.1 acylase [Burkholderia sp. BDU5]
MPSKLPSRRNHFLRWFACVPLALGLQSCVHPGGEHPVSDTRYQVQIRRTALGIPHLKADDWGSLGYGYGYVQAQDNLCTMAESFVTYRGERSRYFGANARPSDQATFGQPDNLDADFFFRFVDDDAAVARYRRAQTRDMRALIDGFAEGYNRYLDDLAHAAVPAAHGACRSAPWVGRITSADVYRRLYAANLAGGEARFASAIATAVAPTAPAAATLGARPLRGNRPAGALASDAPLPYVGGHAGIGSNALAFGADATRNSSALLLGNPHWFWTGPDRFYQAQLTIPGKLDVSGVSFLGVPLIVIGFNRNVAWTHTVSTAKRFGLFRLKLAPGSPTTYVYDGRVEAMTATRIQVAVRAADGSLQTVSRTLYRSRFGPLVNLGSMSPALAWNTQQAFAIRDVNADNFRVFENFLEWDQASSLDDFIRIQRKNAAVPWVNTLAIGRGDPRAWYADIGAVPDAPDALIQRCTPSTGVAIAHVMPGVPVLDGSNTACNWQVDTRSVQAGALPAEQMPSLLRRDYVGNFNGSYWLANPATPLTGYARIVGQTDVPQSLRTRLGHAIAMRLQADPEGVSANALGSAALDSTSMSARLYKKPVLDRLCGNTRPAEASPDELREACAVLAAWNDTGASDAAGAALWDALWRRLLLIPPEQLYAVPFDPSRPLATPAGIAAAPAQLAAALHEAIAVLRNAGIALDAPRDATLYVQRKNERIALFGGCDAAGYFTAACVSGQPNPHASPASGTLLGNTYLQIVSFADDGVSARTLLASSESDDSDSPHYADGTRAYAAKRWLQVPFSDAAIERDPMLITHRLTSRDIPSR